MAPHRPDRVAVSKAGGFDLQCSTDKFLGTILILPRRRLGLKTPLQRFKAFPVVALHWRISGKSFFLPAFD